MKRAAYVFLCLVSFAAAALAEDVDRFSEAAKIEFFESKIRPVLVNQCYDCHAGGNSEGGLRVDSRTAIRSGGDRGPAVVPKHSQASVLLTAISHRDADLKMPPKRIRPKHG